MCTDQLFEELSRHFLPKDLLSLAITLRLKDSEFKQIEENHKNDSRRQIMEVLWKWRELKGRSATYLELIKSLVHIKTIEDAECVIDYFKRSIDQETYVEKDSGNFIPHNSIDLLYVYRSPKSSR